MSNLINLLLALLVIAVIAIAISVSKAYAVSSVLTASSVYTPLVIGLLIVLSCVALCALRLAQLSATSSKVPKAVPTLYQHSSEGTKILYTEPVVGSPVVETGCIPNSLSLFRASRGYNLKKLQRDLTIIKKELQIERRDFKYWSEEGESIKMQMQRVVLQYVSLFQQLEEAQRAAEKAKQKEDEIISKVEALNKQRADVLFIENQSKRIAFKSKYNRPSLSREDVFSKRSELLKKLKNNRELIERARRIGGCDSVIAQALGVSSYSQLVRSINGDSELQPETPEDNASEHSFRKAFASLFDRLPKSDQSAPSASNIAKQEKVSLRGSSSSSTREASSLRGQSSTPTAKKLLFGLETPKQKRSPASDVYIKPSPSARVSLSAIKSMSSSDARKLLAGSSASAPSARPTKSDKNTKKIKFDCP